MSSNFLNNVRFDFVRYANSWEDADVLLKGLNAKPGRRFLSIASGGDNSFSLLVTNPAFVVATDINPIQLKLVALKKVAIQCLNREEYLGFIGLQPSTTRWEIYTKIRHVLPSETRKFWNNRKQLIENGLIFNGKFEKYFLFFSKRIQPLIHSKKRVCELLAEKTGEEQRRFYYKKWNTWKWKWFFKLFFNKLILGKYGRDPTFFKEVDASVSKTIFQKTEAYLTSTGVQNNYMLHFILTGSFGRVLPHYVQKENYQKIKTNIKKLVIAEGPAQDAMKKYGDFDYFNLSDIFEYMDKSTFKAAIKKFYAGASKNARFAYWNFMVSRRMSAIFPVYFSYQKELSNRLNFIDKGFFYDRFIIDELNFVES
jgi:S-adenosylmethionine-diacylglycerol 3-amino-3-carboxypropyl transferase